MELGRAYFSESLHALEQAEEDGEPRESQTCDQLQSQAAQRLHAFTDLKRFVSKNTNNQEYMNLFRTLLAK